MDAKRIITEPKVLKELIERSVKSVSSNYFKYDSF